MAGVGGETGITGKVDPAGLTGVTGFVVGVKAFLAMKPKATEEEIRKGLNGNLCRCGTYANVIQAALKVVKGGA